MRLTFSSSLSIVCVPMLDHWNFYQDPPSPHLVYQCWITGTFYQDPPSLHLSQDLESQLEEASSQNQQLETNECSMNKQLKVSPSVWVSQAREDMVAVYRALLCVPGM